MTRTTKQYFCEVIHYNLLIIRGQKFMYNRKQDQKQLHLIMNKAVNDADFKERFRKNPKGVLEEYNIACQEGVDYIVVEDSQVRKYFVLPSDVESYDAKPDSIVHEEVNPFLKPLY